MHIFLKSAIWLFLGRGQAFLVKTGWQPRLLDWQNSSRLRSRTENNCLFMLCLHL